MFKVLFMFEGNLRNHISEVRIRHRNCDGAKYITRNFKFAEIESSEKN